VQTALDAFQAAVQDARPIINSANGIVTSHKGFDDSGKVTDRTQAIETVKELGQHLKDARAAMNGTGQTLRQAIKAFREAHRSTQVPTTTP
jgi:ABC-type transporter Mla subunit MlaD